MKKLIAIAIGADLVIGAIVGGGIVTSAVSSVGTWGVSDKEEVTLSSNQSTLNDLTEEL